MVQAGCPPNVAAIDVFALPGAPPPAAAAAARTPLARQPEIAGATLSLSEAAFHALPTRLAASWRYETALDGRVELPPASPLPLVAMVTERELGDGDELFFDYKLARGARPAWYSPVVATWPNSISKTVSPMETIC
eukprot:SAG11_NODE_850_length_6868_cov_3.543523_6_plen_136_part_00